MKRRLISIMNTGRKSRLLAVACVAAVTLATFLSGSVFTFASPNRLVTYISADKAKAIALEHAGLLENQATFLKAHMDFEDGRVVYDVEFYSGNTEYDYEIDAVNGKILEFDRDIEYFSIDNGFFGIADATQYIGEDKAKSIALEHAGILEEQATFIKVHMDYDDGRVVYDIEFYSGNTEYDYEIDAINGDIIEFDREIEYYSIPKTTKNRNNASNQGLPKTAPVSAAQYIGEVKAKSIALSAAKLSESQVRKMKVKLDREDGIMVYEVEFEHGKVEYEYEINATSGTIIKADVDYD